jgi:hypothetical protein
MPVMQYQTFKTREIQQTECEKLRGGGENILGGKISSSTAHKGSFFLNSIEKYNKYHRRSYFLLTSSCT